MLTSMFSAVSGLNANGTEISVIGNNIANSNTVGFKAERTSFSDIMSSSIGAGAYGQVGRGTKVASIMPVFTQSSFDTTSNPTDLAIDGRGFFVVKDPKAENLFYTRAGDFIFNKDGLLVNPDGYVVQGWRVDETTGEPVGDIGNIDISKISSSSKPTSKITLGANLNSTSEPKFVVTDYNNTIVYNDGSGEKVIKIEDGIYTGESLAEKIQSKFGIDGFQVTYESNTGKFDFINNTASTNITIKFKQTSATDTNITTMGSLLGFKVIDRDNADSDNNELTGVDDITIAAGTNFKSDTYPDLTQKIFRVTDQNNVIKFSEDGGTTILTATISPGDYTDEPYADNNGDQYTSIAKAVEDALNNASTDANLTYKVTFDKDTGKFNIIVNNAGGSDATVKFYWGDDTIEGDPGEETTAEQLLGFVRKTSDTQNNPSVVNSFEITAAAGSSGSLTSVYAPYSIFDKSSYDYSSSINIYDSLGNPHTITFYFKKVAGNYWEWHAVANSSDLDGALPDENGNPQPYEIGNGGYLIFNSSGSLKEATGIDDLYFNFSGGSEQLQHIVFNPGTPTTKGGTGLDGVTQFASASTTFSQSQDGNPAGTLTGVQVDKDGIIHGIYTNGEIKPLAKLAIAKFLNPWGLAKEGKNLFAQTVQSGDAIMGAAGTGGRGQIVSNALEHSNVDIAEEFVKLIMAQRAFQANSRVITTSDQLLLDVVSLKR